VKDQPSLSQARVKATGNSFAYGRFFVDDFFGFILPCVM